jgi:hypothetical protein
MFGLEKKGKPPFEFDLEKEVKGNPSKAKDLLKVCEERIQELKSLLRQGANTADYDNYGILLHGYAALQKVLTKLANKK